MPVNGPVGDLLRAQGRHNLRPAHMHFLIHKPGFKTQFSQLYSSDDPNLDTDVQFGVTPALIANTCGTTAAQHRLRTCTARGTRSNTGSSFNPAKRAAHARPSAARPTASDRLG